MQLNEKNQAQIKYDNCQMYNTNATSKLEESWIPTVHESTFPLYKAHQSQQFGLTSRETQECSAHLFPLLFFPCCFFRHWANCSNSSAIQHTHTDTFLITIDATHLVKDFMKWTMLY